MLRPIRLSPFALAASAALAWCSAGCSASGSGSSSQQNPTSSSPQDSSGGGSSSQPTLDPGLTTVPDLGPVQPAPEEKCDAVLKLTIRDFQPSTHPDFEAYQGLNDIGCGMVSPTLGSDLKPVFVSGIGTMKRVTSGDWDHLALASCADWNGWTPTDVITSQASFDQWYRDVPNVNQAFEIDVALTDDGSGSGNLTYDTNAFFPIDGMGFGNSANQQHNFHFTTEGHVKFGYVAGQKFTFRGDDDLWIFVNGKLALDLGGVHRPISSTLDFDAQAADLGIHVGGTYQMDIFHAERHTNESHFRIETNIRCFEPVKVK